MHNSSARDVWTHWRDIFSPLTGSQFTGMGMPTLATEIILYVSGSCPVLAFVAIYHVFYDKTIIEKK